MNRLKSYPPHIQQSNSISTCSVDSLFLQTNEAGWVSLDSRALEIFNRLTNLEGYHLQTKHAYARLISKTSPLRLSKIQAGEIISDAYNRLSIHEGNRFQAQGHVSVCKCCGSPGKIVFLNPYGIEVMQISALSTLPLIEWGKVLVKCADASYHTPANEWISYPIIPEEVEYTPLKPSSIVRLFKEARERSIAFEVSLFSSGILHQEAITPLGIRLNEGSLTVAGHDVNLQLYIPAIHDVYCDQEALYPTFYLSGSDSIQLLKIQALCDYEDIKPLLFPE